MLKLLDTLLIPGRLDVNKDLEVNFCESNEVQDDDLATLKFMGSFSNFLRL